MDAAGPLIAVDANRVKPVPLAVPPPVPLLARRHWLVAQINHGLRRWGGWDVGTNQRTEQDSAKRTVPIVVGVSGGADSTAMLVGCWIFANRTREVSQRLCPVAVHVHHHLRESADADAEFVTQLCARLAIP